MIVENPEEFMAWMTKVLEPQCDADPIALAKYIYALVKKHKKSVEELRKKLIDQLEVFLSKNTETFVDELFEKIKEHNSAGGATCEVKTIKQEPGVNPREESVNKSSAEDSEELVLDASTNLTNPPDVENETDLESSNIPLPDTPAEQPPPVVPAAVVQPLREAVSLDLEPQVTEEVEKAKPTSFVSSNGSLSRQSERHHSSSLSHERRTEPERDDRERSAREARRRNSSGSPPVRRSERSERSRSRSWDRRMSRRSRSRSRRSRSRGRDRDRSRPFRNKSPPPPRNQKGYERERRIRSYSKSPTGRSSRSRTPPSKSRSRYRNRSPFTRSRSPYDSPRNANASSPPESSMEDDTLRSVSQGVQSVVTKLVRCKDFDEKGFCMRGEMCPYDHGNDPVVLEDLGQVLSYSAPPGLTSVPPPGHPGQNHYRAPVHANLGRPMLRGGPAVGLVRTPMYSAAHQRELIRVPMEEHEAQYFPTPSLNPKKRSHPADYSGDMDSIHPMKQRFDYNRLGLRSKGGGVNSSLQLKKIPAGLNNIAHLHNHFVKFGNIVKIQVCFEGDPEAALITFTTNAEASAACKSTEAVLNNRFIKVFWYNGDNTNKLETVMPVARTSAKERLGAPVVNHLLSNPQSSSINIKENQENETQKVLFSGSNITKTVYIPTPLDKKPVVAKPDTKKMLITTHNFFASQEALAAKEALKKKEETRLEGLKLTQNITKKKHELLDKLLLNQKQLITKLEKEEHTPEQKAEIMSTIQLLQENIKSITQELKENVSASALKPTTSAMKVTPQLVKKSREETLKQMLDAELDLITQQQEGKDVSELRKKVHELKTKEQSLNMLNNNGVHMARGGSRYRAPRGRGFNPHTMVDHRPTKLLVSGFESDDKAEVLEHFSKFGEVVDKVWDEATPALVIQYKTRKDAENAMAQGRNFQDRLMSVTWYNPAQNMGMSSSVRSVVMYNESELLAENEEEEEELRKLEESEDLLLGDEEEDEDDERTWRR